MHTTTLHTAHPPRAAANWRIMAGLLLRQRGSLSPTFNFLSSAIGWGPSKSGCALHSLQGCSHGRWRWHLHRRAHLLYPRYRLGCAEDWTQATPTPPAHSGRSSRPALKTGDPNPATRARSWSAPARVKRVPRETQKRGARVRRRELPPCLAKPNSTERSESAQRVAARGGGGKGMAMTDRTKITRLDIGSENEMLPTDTNSSHGYE
jgi:hypothetical protein